MKYRYICIVLATWHKHYKQSHMQNTGGSKSKVGLNQQYNQDKLQGTANLDISAWKLYIFSFNVQMYWTFKKAL